MRRLAMALMVIAAFLFHACEETSMNNNDEGITNEIENLISKDAAIEEILTETDFEVDYFSGSNEAIRQSMTGPVQKNGWIFPFGGRYMIGQCPNVTVDTLPGRFPLTITLDYGDSTMLSNGRVISGVILIEVSAPPLTNGAIRQVRCRNFNIDSIGIEGHYTCEFRLGDSTINGAFICTREMNFNFPDSTHIVCSSYRVRRWIRGLRTPFVPSDDEIHITGHSNFIGSEGNVYSREIIKRLVKTGDCRFITEGTIEFSVNGRQIGLLDYGNGTCDNIATLSRNGERKLIRLGQYNRRNRPQ